MRKFVASPGIEPGSGASETLILSIVLRGQLFKNKLPIIYFLMALILSPSERRSAGRALYYEANFSKINFLLYTSYDSYTIPVRTAFSRAGIVLRGHFFCRAANVQ